MSRYSSIIGVFALAFTAPLVASAASVALYNLTPGSSITVASSVSLSVVPSDISYPSYSVQDSFSNSTASSNNIEPGGRFSWVPSTSDVGTHVLTFSATGSDGSASATQTITVLPPPSMSIGPVSPGTNVLPGTPLTFSVTTSGFTNPTFTVGDVSSNPSVRPDNLTAAGNFSWTPTLSDKGDHAITVYVSDSLGHSASKSVSVHVGQGPSLSVVLLSPGLSVSPGQVVTFTAAPNEYAPTGFSLQDSFPGSTASSNSMNLSGQFSWSPAQSDVGVHVFTITGVVGAYGTSASTTQTITVLGPGGVVPSAATTGSSDTLAALQAKLAALKGALATQSGSSLTTAANSIVSFTSYLHPGSTGEEVTHLQQVLAQLGLFSATPNGNYGPATTKAVMKFQAAHGLDQLGVVGPSTRTALNALGSSPAATQAAAQTNGYVFEHFMGVGDDDPDVLQLQQRLVALGFYAGDTTGYYGAATEAAVKKYQTSRGITVTGYVGSETRAALNR